MEAFAVEVSGCRARRPLSGHTVYILLRLATSTADYAGDPVALSDLSPADLSQPRFLTPSPLPEWKCSGAWGVHKVLGRQVGRRSCPGSEAQARRGITPLVSVPRLGIAKDRKHQHKGER